MEGNAERLSGLDLAIKILEMQANWSLWHVGGYEAITSREHPDLFIVACTDYKDRPDFTLYSTVKLLAKSKFIEESIEWQALEYVKDDFPEDEWDQEKDNLIRDVWNAIEEEYVGPFRIDDDVIREIIFGMDFSDCMYGDDNDSVYTEED